MGWTAEHDHTPTQQTSHIMCVLHEIKWHLIKAATKIVYSKFVKDKYNQETHFSKKKVRIVS